MAKQFGKWMVVDQLDEGGQAHVYKVTHEDTGQVGALKRLKNVKRIARFQKEVEAAKTLRHPTIVPLVDANVEEEPFFAVFEFHCGRSLARLGDQLRDVSISQRIIWCEQLCSALEEAHSNGCIHRDIKPDNILISQDLKSASLCDFGLVYIDEGERVTATMEQVGSRYYIAPESEEGRAHEVSPATDLYSLGKVLYFVCSGGHMFARERQRDSQNDLVTREDNPYLEAILRVMDEVVIEDVSKRISSATKLQKLLAAARRTVMKELPCPGAKKTYRCVFCQTGVYDVVANSTDMANSGYNEGNVGKEHMVYLECTECGNSQRFKLKRGGIRWFPDTLEQLSKGGRRVPGLAGIEYSNG